MNDFRYLQTFTQATTNKLDLLAAYTTKFGALIAGKKVFVKLFPEKPVRKGAEKAKIKLNLGEYNLTRTINTNGTHTLKLENAKGLP